MTYDKSVPQKIVEILIIYTQVLVSKVQLYRLNKKHLKEMRVWDIKIRANRRYGAYLAWKDFAAGDDFSIEILRKCMKKAP